MVPGGSGSVLFIGNNGIERYSYPALADLGVIPPSSGAYVSSLAITPSGSMLAAATSAVVRLWCSP